MLTELSNISDLHTKRKVYLALVRRRIRPGTGSNKAFLARRTAEGGASMLAEVFKKTPFVVVGGVATRLYMPVRMTLDIDILVLVEDREICERELALAGCKKLGELSIGGATWRLPESTELDVIFSDAPWAREAITYPVRDDEGIPTISLPYLVVMKLYAGRVQDIADITRMLGAADGEQIQQVRQIVRKYAPDAVEDIESMIILGRMEYEEE